MRRLDEVRRGGERVRVGPWRAGGGVAVLAPSGPQPPGEGVVREACEAAARRGFREILTGALAPAEQAGFLAAGFEVRDRLHLLVHDLRDLPTAPPLPTGTELRRGRRADRGPALSVDARAFVPFWRLDETGLAEAMTATPSARFRVATRDGDVLGYAVTGRAGARGYLQRLAVDPDAAGSGLGRALVHDALAWLRRRHVTEAFVNTQVANDRALDLYRRAGFRLHPDGLAVLGRVLVHPTPA